MAKTRTNQDLAQAGMEIARRRRATALKLLNGGKTQIEIAKRMNVSRQRMGQMIAKAREEAAAMEA